MDRFTALSRTPSPGRGAAASPSPTSSSSPRCASSSPSSASSSSWCPPGPSTSPSMNTATTSCSPSPHLFKVSLETVESLNQIQNPYFSGCVVSFLLCFLNKERWFRLGVLLLWKQKIYIYDIIYGLRYIRPFKTAVDTRRFAPWCGDAGASSRPGCRRRRPSRRRRGCSWCCRGSWTRSPPRSSTSGTRCPWPPPATTTSQPGSGPGTHTPEIILTNVMLMLNQMNVYVYSHVTLFWIICNN